MERAVSAGDRRATDITHTDTGWAKVIATEPGHVETARSDIIDLLDHDDIADLDRIMAKVLPRLDPHRRISHVY